MSETLEPTDLDNEPRRYPWGEWLDGKPRRLVWGEDFDPEPKVFRTYAYAKARKAGKRLAIVIEPTDDIVMQAYEIGRVRPLLPSPYRRKANGRIDLSAPQEGVERLPAPDPARTCRVCSERLTPAGAKAGECMRVDLANGARLVRVHGAGQAGRA